MEQPVREKSALVVPGFLFLLLTLYPLTSGLRGDGQKVGLVPIAKRAPGPNLVLRDLDNKPWNLRGNAHRGRVLLVNYWATWCAPCRKETPGLVRIAGRYAGKGLDVVGVSRDTGGPDIVRAFVQEMGVSYPVVLAPANDTALPFPIEALPTTLLLDRRGGIAKRYVGAVSEATLTADLDRLLSER